MSVLIWVQTVCKGYQQTKKSHHLQVKSIQLSGTSVSPSDSGYEGDFVIFYSDKDAIAAKNFKKDLEEDIPDIEADLFPYIDQNMTLYGSLETLLDRFRYVLMIISSNFKSDVRIRRAGEDLQNDSFSEEHKMDRITAVWISSEKKNCPLEYSRLKGISYYQRGDKDFGSLYIEGLRKHVEKMRKESVEWDKKRREQKSQAS